MSAVEPAPITLSKDVTRIGIINRSLPSEGNKTADKIDQILSAEGLNLDKEGSTAAIIALKEQLQQNQNMEEIIIIDDTPNLRKGLGVFPTTLTWNEVEILCDQYKVDALFSLEFYDTDTKVNFTSTTMEIPNELGVRVILPAHELTLNTDGGYMTLTVGVLPMNWFLVTMWFLLEKESILLRRMRPLSEEKKLYCIKVNIWEWIMPSAYCPLSIA